MKAGRELDALVAEKVMGLEISRRIIKYKGKEYLQLNVVTDYQAWDPGELNDFNTLREYSTDIAAAWQVVEKLEDEFEFLMLRSPRRAKDLWTFELTNRVTRAWYSVDAETVPHAICLAALKAVGVEL